ncbi:MAG: alpha/beta hydrolase [Janthinobacterium lividum]
MNNGTKRILMGLASLAGVWAGCALSLSVKQQKLVFNPIRIREVARPRSSGHRSRSVVLYSDDRTRLSGWLLTPVQPASQPGAVLYFGGRSEEVSWVVQDAGRLFPGMTVLVMNYRGYGDSHGIPGERQMIEDGKFLFDWLVRSREDIDRKRIAVVGRSLGSGVAVQLAVQRPVAAVVLVTPYDSVLAVASRRFRVMPISLLLKHRFESIKFARNITAPVLVLRAASDTVVPHFHTELLVKKLGGQVFDETIAASNHSTIPYLASTQERIALFLGSVFTGVPAQARVSPSSMPPATGTAGVLPAGHGAGGQAPAGELTEEPVAQAADGGGAAALPLRSTSLPRAIEPPIPSSQA